MGTRLDSGFQWFLLTPWMNRSSSVRPKCFLRTHTHAEHNTLNNLSYLSAEDENHHPSHFFVSEQSQSALSPRNGDAFIHSELVLSPKTDLAIRILSCFLLLSTSAAWAAWSPSASCWTRTVRCRGRPAGQPNGPCFVRRTTWPSGRRRRPAHSPVHSSNERRISPVALSSFSAYAGRVAAADMWVSVPERFAKLVPPVS